jgi:hypothetical protein
MLSLGLCPKRITGRCAEKSIQSFPQLPSSREGHEALAGSVKTFRNVGDVEKDTAGL